MTIGLDWAFAMLTVVTMPIEWVGVESWYWSCEVTAKWPVEPEVVSDAYGVSIDVSYSSDVVLTGITYVPV